MTLPRQTSLFDLLQDERHAAAAAPHPEQISPRKAAPLGGTEASPEQWRARADAGDGVVFRRAPGVVALHGAGSWTGAPDADFVTDVADALAARLNATLPVRGLARLARLTVTDNRRAMVSLRRHGADRYTLRVCRHLLVDHADVVASAVAVCLVSGRFPDELGVAIRTLSPPPPDDARIAALDARGKHQDLLGALARSRALLRDLPAAQNDVAIGWTGSAREAADRRRSIRLGAARPDLRTIRIHRVLDATWVPVLVVEMVVHHELCHIVAPPLTRAEATRSQERRVHHSRFRALERRFPRLDEANRWIDAHLQSLLRF